MGAARPDAGLVGRHPLIRPDTPLLSQWEFLQEQVVPRLLEGAAQSARATLWAAGDVADAVAVSVAYGSEHQGPDPSVEAFATAGAGEPGAPHYSLAEIRLVPEGVRRTGFCRAERGWVPAPGIAEHILLGRPTGPVDLVLVRKPAPPAGEPTPYSSYLRPGGHMVVLGSDPEEFERDKSFERIPGTCILRRKKSGRTATAGGGEYEDPGTRTLAKKLFEEDLVARHVNLARSLARRFSNHGDQAEDLRQVAFVGLLLAARRYDPSQNASFSTYATATILGELKRYFRDKSWMMRVPRQVQEAYLAIKATREELYQELSCSPTITQIAARMRISEEAVLEAIEAGDNFLPQSLDTGPDDDSPGRDIPVTEHAYDVLLDRTLLMQALPRLSQRERLVLKRVYLDGWTQRRVAEEIGVSQMQVSRLLHASGHKIRTWTGA